MFNTARGTCYTFEDVSALLVNEVLAGKRESPIDTVHIATVTGATKEQVIARTGHRVLSRYFDAYRTRSRSCVH